jgi:lysophospholipase L1-like esterase
MTWDILDYLAELRRTRGIDVVVVHWPLNHQPSGACYDVRISDARLAQFLEWLRVGTTERGLEYLDLHDLLRPDEFVDSVHLTAEGHRRVAAALAPVVENVVRRRISE